MIGAIYDASFVRLRRVAATWRVPTDLAARIGAESLSLTLTAHNPAMLWQATKDIFGYPILDPEQHETNADFNGSGLPAGLEGRTLEGWTTTKRVSIAARVVF